MTDLVRPLGLRTHLRSAAAACEGRAWFHEAQTQQPEANQRDARIWNALRDLFDEAAEVVGEGHEDVLDRAVLAAADALLEYTEPTGHAPLTDESTSAHPHRGGGPT